MKPGTCLFLLATALAAAAETDFVPGDSLLEFDTVTYALHVPGAAAEPRGPTGLFVFFGGAGDSMEYYQKALAPLADELDLILVVPRMPWFVPPGRTSAHAVLASLDGLHQALAARFQTDPNLVIVGGASAGGGSACRLAKRWAPRVPLLVLHSTNRCLGLPTTRVVLLVGENEAGFLGDEASSGKRLRQGPTDLFAVPREQHQVHFTHMRAWLETELSAWRLARADGEVTPATLQRARQLLTTSLPETDDFLKYQNERRKELAGRYSPAIEKANAP